jgi:hypothetical protein
MKSETNWLIWPAEPSSCPSAACDEPLIHGPRANENVKTLPNETTNQSVDKEAATGEDERGDLLI